MIKTVEFAENGNVLLIDQRKLPTKEIVNEYSDYKEVAKAIVEMVVRGAPAIGVTAAGGIALGVRAIETADIDVFKREYELILELLGATRPTAVNLFWAIERMRKLVNGNRFASVDDIKQAVYAEARKILAEDIVINEKMGFNGAELIKDGDTILTHCNAGALATAGHYGTALGVIKAAHISGKNIKVFADETRPRLQGANLTAWEMVKEGIDVTLITDSMAGYFMKMGKIDRIVVGSDRIAGNGDVANKIGTYSVAVLAKRHNIPFYVAAPMSTIDFDMPNGDGIPIEERNKDEVLYVMGGKRVTPEGVNIMNPAFDITPNDLVEAIITEKGVARKPFTESLGKLRNS